MYCFLIETNKECFFYNFNKVFISREKICLMIYLTKIYLSHLAVAVRLHSNSHVSHEERREKGSKSYKLFGVISMVGILRSLIEFLKTDSDLYLTYAENNSSVFKKYL